jgi:hypothetical protein
MEFAGLFNSSLTTEQWTRGENGGLEMAEKTRWYKFWHGGKIGHGPSETVYYQPDRNIRFCGFRRLDFPKADVSWKNLGVGNTIETISGAIVEKIQ